MNQADLWNQKGFDVIEHNIKSKNKEEVDDIKKMLKDFLSSYPYATVLEFGCGTGYYSEYIKPLVKSIIGVDISSSGVEMTKERGVPAILGDIEKIDFEHYDIVYGIAILHHTEHPMDNLMKASRIARKAVFFIEPNGSNPFRRLAEKLVYPKDSHECSFDMEALENGIITPLTSYRWFMDTYSAYKSISPILRVLDRIIERLPFSFRKHFSQSLIIIGVRI